MHMLIFLIFFSLLSSLEKITYFKVLVQSISYQCFYPTRENIIFNLILAEINFQYWQSEHSRTMAITIKF